MLLPFLAVLPPWSSSSSSRMGVRLVATFPFFLFFFPLERGEEEDDGEEDERKRIRNEVQYRDNYDGEDTGEP
jgi:hypothetical protein